MEERIREENRRIKEWEDKFDQEQKLREEELIRKFYSNNPTNTSEETSSEETLSKEKDDNIKE